LPLSVIAVRKLTHESAARNGGRERETIKHDDSSKKYDKSLSLSTSHKIIKHTANLLLLVNLTLSRCVLVRELVDQSNESDKEECEL